MSYSNDDKTSNQPLKKCRIWLSLSEPEKYRLAELIFDGLPQSEQICIARAWDKLTAAATLDESLYVVAPLLEKFAAVEPQ